MGSPLPAQYRQGCRQRDTRQTGTDVQEKRIEFEINGQGGVYNFVITGLGDDEYEKKKNYLHVYQVVQDNKVNILWQVPQIAILTAAEILFSVTGNEFAYSQVSAQLHFGLIRHANGSLFPSAPSMKSVVQALWLLTNAVGDVIIVIITALDLFDDMAVQFFAYAGIMFFVICIYALMAFFYFDYQHYT